jgi:subtilisin
MAEETAKTPGAGPAPAVRVLDHGRRQFIIAPCRGSQALGARLRPLSGGALRGLIGQIPGLEIVRVLRARVPVSAMSLSADEATEVYLVRIDPERAGLIRQTMPPQLIMEEDTPLDYPTPVAPPYPGPTGLATWSSTTSLETRQIRFRVVGEGERPLINVAVSLAGDGAPQEGRTDKRGEVTLPLVALPGTRARTLFVNAPNNHWDQYLVEPEPSDADVNVVRLRAIGETISGFPERFRYGWGQIQMGLHRVPETLTGTGVRIAIIDSGVDTSHPLLRHIRHGLDLTPGGDPQTWTQDVVGHGSHCAGIIAAHDEAGKMLRGFVPEAEIHVLRVLPGGRVSSVIEALDYCLEREIDVVNLGVSRSRPSPAFEQKIEEATLHGLACIVGAEDSGALWAYSGSPPYALAVAAVGRLNEYPDKSSDATTAWPISVAADGIFMPSFCHGQGVAVCAPGVGVISTVPGGFQPRSGSAVAASHVTGLAALLLAHHAAFMGSLRTRDQKRVAGLFNMIRLMSVPYAFGVAHAAAGLPRLHGLEQVLQPRPQSQSAETPTAVGNDPAASTMSSIGSAVVPGGPLSTLGPLVPVFAPTFSVPLLMPPVRVPSWVTPSSIRWP